MDVHVPAAVTEGLRHRGVDVLTSQEDLTNEWDDSQLLARATALSRVLFSMDTDLRREAVTLQRAGKPFAGLIAADQLRVAIGQCIDDLELIAKVCSPNDLADVVLYLPLK
jgi:predicted nuclease of predicted toxin-antitoxin system